MLNYKHQINGGMKLTAELTAEQIVTNLLSSHEILKRSKENFYINSTNSLGEYLENLPEEAVVEEPSFVDESLAKYSFIKNSWKI